MKSTKEANSLPWSFASFLFKWTFSVTSLIETEGWIKIRKGLHSKE